MEDTTKLEQEFNTQMGAWDQSSKPTPESLYEWKGFAIPDSSRKIIRKSFPYTYFQVAAVTIDKVIITLPNYSEVLSCWMNVVTAFAGPATVTASLGPAASETTMLTAQSIKTTGLKKAIGTDFTTNRAIFSTSAGTDIETRITGAANLSGLTAGELEFAFVIIDYTGDDGF